MEYFNAGDQGVQREREHRAVLHADDPAQAGAAARSDHDRIRDAATVHEARETGGRCALRPDRAAARTAAMADLLRAKVAPAPRNG
ncbi:hypothetical protein E1293_18515 [Actinomadura darangshiensis]|uniref:Uncharacterized protein n=1 Tax=Actinomadura darangshiensis TaxID=705336 RepID=A0A4R5B7V4_9ACTN|nr:hypothetical protein [Actinomadura darangshiensis]TDD81465.1 hypothetical protein E1293_18515 [Actinomadura darangshiensis]